jgi:sporulation protein YlmC with PRC-barrel domain
MTSSTINLDNVRGVEVTGAEGVKLGKVDNIYIDDDTNQPEWIAVKSGLFGTHVSLVPISKAQFDGAVLSVPFDKEQLKSAPHHHPNTDLTPLAEKYLYNHYGMPYGPHSGSLATDSEHSKPEDHAGQPGAQARGTSGPTGIGRLRKYWGSRNATKTLPVSGEKVRLERELGTEANRDDAMSGWVLVAEEHEFTLLGDMAVVVKETVVLERELLGIVSVSGEETVSDADGQGQIDEPKTNQH